MIKCINILYFFALKATQTALTRVKKKKKKINGAPYRSIYWRVGTQLATLRLLQSVALQSNHNQWQVLFFNGVQCDMGGAYSSLQTTGASRRHNQPSEFCESPTVCLCPVACRCLCLCASLIRGSCKHGAMCTAGIPLCTVGIPPCKHATRE